MFVMLEHEPYGLRQIASRFGIGPACDDFTAEHVTYECSDVPTVHPAVPAEFKRTVKQAVFHESDRSDLCDVAIVDPTKASVAGPWFREHTCLDDAWPGSGVVLKKQRRMQKCEFHT